MIISCSDDVIDGTYDPTFRTYDNWTYGKVTRSTKRGPVETEAIIRGNIAVVHMLSTPDQHEDG